MPAAARVAAWFRRRRWQAVGLEAWSETWPLVTDLAEVLGPLAAEPRGFGGRASVSVEGVLPVLALPPWALAFTEVVDRRYANRLIADELALSLLREEQQVYTGQPAKVANRPRDHAATRPLAERIGRLSGAATDHAR